MNIKYSLIVLLVLAIAGFFGIKLFVAKPALDKEKLKQRYEKSVNHFPEIIEVSSAKSKVNEKLSGNRKSAIVKSIALASPAVVSITVKKKRELEGRNITFNDAYFDKFLSDQNKSIIESFSSVGSGVIVNENGYILTNNHVIGVARGERMVEIKVSVAGNKQYKAEITGVDPDNDIAVLKINGKNLPTGIIQAKGDNFIGEWVIAIGNPLGFLMEGDKPTVTVGVISALNRNFSASSGIGYSNMIQTDASINPGNSGGALVNALGEVIGINTFILSDGVSTGLGFAIPIQKAMRVVEELVEYGYIRQWTTGIFTNPYSSPSGVRQGIHISEIEKGLPGHKAGLEKGDIIVSVAGNRIININGFLGILRKYQVGESVTMEYFRNDEKFSTTMVLQENEKKSKTR